MFLVIKHCCGFWRSLQYKHHLKKIIKDSTSKQNNYVLPARKSLLALWRIHGFSAYGDKDEVKLDVLSGWIRIFYGDELAEDIDLSCRLKTIRMQQAKNFCKCVDNDVHCSFMAPFDTLVYNLSEELPEYC